MVSLKLFQAKMDGWGFVARDGQQMVICIVWKIGVAISREWQCKVQFKLRRWQLCTYSLERVYHLWMMTRIILETQATAVLVNKGLDHSKGGAWSKWMEAFQASHRSYWNFHFITVVFQLVWELRDCNKVWLITWQCMYWGEQR